MKVLVTGAGGFIGSHVVEELLENGHEVRGLLRYNSESRIGNLRFVDLERWGDRLELTFGDVCDSRLMLEVADGCDAILHLAALIGIPYSYVAPESYIDTNIRGTLTALEATRALGVPRLIVTSTSEVYGTALYAPIDEKHPLQAQSPYSATKVAADKLADSYYRSFDTPVVVLRPFNTYGPRQSARAIIPTIVTQLVAEQPALRIGSLDPKRDLTYVKDTARAFRLTMEREGIEGQTIHFGTNRTVSVGEIAELCMQITGHRVPIEQDPDRVRPAKSEVGLLLAEPARARELLGWEAEVTLEQGLAEVVEFVRQNAGQFAPQRYNI